MVERSPVRQDGAMPDRLPLPALLSQALVAVTIELDDEFEHPARVSSRQAASCRASRALSN